MASIIAIYKRQNKRLKIVLQAMACGLLIAILFFLGDLHGKSSAKAYVYVDVNRVMRAIVSSLDVEHLSADELNAQIDSHRQKFQELLSDYSASDNVMIIAKPKVISGAPDKTDFLLKSYWEAMRETGFYIAALLFSAAQVQAANLGHYGSTFTIAEADLLHVIESKLKSYESSGELARFNSRYRKAVAKQVIRPNRVVGVSKAVENRTRKFDPSIFLDEDIVIPDEATGSFKVLYGAGTKINPLDYTPFQETLIFIDGESASQVQFAHETHDKNKAAKIILVNGRPGIKQHEDREYYYYFDQFGGYSSRFGITRVPSLVYQLGVEKVLTIQEVEVK